jgi:hypothetical protein
LLGVSDPGMVTLNPMKERRLRGWKLCAERRKRKEKEKEKKRKRSLNQISTLDLVRWEEA